MGNVLGVDTDVLCQWRTLMPTLEKRLTPVEGLFVSDVEVQAAKHVSRLRGEANDHRHAVEVMA